MTTVLVREHFAYADAVRGFLRAGRELVGIGYYGMAVTVLRAGRDAGDRFLQAGLSAPENRQIRATLAAIDAELADLTGDRAAVPVTAAAAVAGHPGL